MPSERTAPEDSPWLRDYGSNRFQWQRIATSTSAASSTHHVYRRPVGNVESSFDSDGRYWEGRADLNGETLLDIRCTLNKDELREKIVLAWAGLRCTHWLIQAKARVHGVSRRSTFVVEVPRSVERVVQEAESNVTFIQDFYATVDHREFWIHAANTARVFDPDKELTRLFIHALEPRGRDRYRLRFLLVGAHMIWDGLSNMVAVRDFVRLLNTDSDLLRQHITRAISSDDIVAQLPLPQEALYPSIKGSRARRRWFWLLTRILRHVRKPLPAAFLNPLRRRQVQPVTALTPTYDRVLDYSRVAPLNCMPLLARASLRATRRLHALCREARVSVGAGCFALAALILMEIYERQFPDIPLAERRPFISGFPLNPRPFFNHHAEPDSVMLAFCDGILLPFLSSDLPLEGRIRLLARQAHRQLSAFQKRRVREPVVDDDGGFPLLSMSALARAEAIRNMSSRGPGRVLANQYLGSIERAEMLLPESRRTDDFEATDAQGAYPARPNATLSTCNISSVGKIDAVLQSGVYDVEDQNRSFVADLIESRTCVRAREGEFLVGCGGDARGLWASVSVDTCAIDPVLAEEWRVRFETILEDDNQQKLDQLEARL